MIQNYFSSLEDTVQSVSSLTDVFREDGINWKMNGKYDLLFTPNKKMNFTNNSNTHEIEWNNTSIYSDYDYILTSVETKRRKLIKR